LQNSKVGLLWSEQNYLLNYQLVHKCNAYYWTMVKKSKFIEFALVLCWFCTLVLMWSKIVKFIFVILSYVNALSSFIFVYSSVYSIKFDDFPLVTNSVIIRSTRQSEVIEAWNSSSARKSQSFVLLLLLWAWQNK